MSRPDPEPRRGTSGLRPRPDTPPPAWEPEQWIDEGAVRREAADAAGRAGRPRAAGPATRPERVEPVHETALDEAVGPKRAVRLREREELAESALRRDRYTEVLRILRPLIAEAPDVASLRRLNGLALYRLGRWKQAIGELELHRDLAGGTAENLPIIADCYRALRRYAKVADLWTELREASPAADVVAEGRIVMAGAMADQGDVRGAIKLMSVAEAVPKRIRPHHVRMWYVLGDLHDRAGETPKARTYFKRVRELEPDYADIDERIAALGR